jgi:deoxyribose-phosphate aldolase
MSKRRLAQRILGLVDLTNLDDACTDADVDRLCARAHGPHGNVAAVCIWPRFVARAVQQLEGTGIPVATVVNFPGGSDETSEIVALIGRCLEDGADEIDVVMPYRALLAGRVDEVVATLDAVRAAVPPTHHVKVILETGELAEPEIIRRASRLAIDHGADFIKTSTGKTKVSATPESVRVMLDVIADSIRPVGLKPSGGIRTLDDAESYLDLADDIMGPTWVSSETFRFGASGLLDALEAELG